MTTFARRIEIKDKVDEGSMPALNMKEIRPYLAQSYFDPEVIKGKGLCQFRSHTIWGPASEKASLGKKPMLRACQRLVEDHEEECVEKGRREGRCVCDRDAYQLNG